MRAANLFYLDMLRRPSPYVVFQLGGSKVTTSTKDNDTNPDWSRDGTVLDLPVYDEPLGLVDVSEHSRVSALQVSLWYRGILTDQLIARKIVPFSTFDPPNFEDQQFFFDTEDFSPK
ncbi:MAG: C2 domain-containing protein, partial [bacterium]